jgi:KaiC/GvpD/RAD55 family RecA-like ATPase
MEIVKSGIDGLDSLIEKKGFPKGSSILVLGAPGSGKSILGMQYIYKGATLYNEKGIYAVFHEHPEKVREYMLSFGWDIDAAGRAEKIMIIDAASPILEKEYIDNYEIKKALSSHNLMVLKRMVSETKAKCSSLQ